MRYKDKYKHKIVDAVYEILDRHHGLMYTARELSGELIIRGKITRESPGIITAMLKQLADEYGIERVLDKYGFHRYYIGEERQRMSPVKARRVLCNWLDDKLKTCDVAYFKSVDVAEEIGSSTVQVSTWMGILMEEGDYTIIKKPGRRWRIDA